MATTKRTVGAKAKPRLMPRAGRNAKNVYTVEAWPSDAPRKQKEREALGLAPETFTRTEKRAAIRFARAQAGASGDGAVVDVFATVRGVGPRVRIAQAVNRSGQVALEEL